GRIEEIEAESKAAVAELKELIDSGAELGEIKKARKKANDLEKGVEDKWRADQRHHALDAMILTMLPHWAGDPGKSLHFGLPKDIDWRRVFGRVLDGVIAEELRFEKPVLRETIYGLRPGPNEEMQAVIRRVVFEMAYEGRSMEGEPIKFGVKELKRWIPSVRDPLIRAKLAEIASDLEGLDSAKEQEIEWRKRCLDLRLSPEGPLIKKVSCWSDKPGIDNYANLAKDRSEEGDRRFRGQWRCAKGSHRGQWLYLDGKGAPRIRAVKVFESPDMVVASLRSDPNCLEVVAFLQAGCVIQIDREVVSGRQTLAAGRYRLGGVEEKKRQIDLKSAAGEPFTKIPLTSLVAAGFSRVSEA
ncbi:MAG: hypothetical protein KDM63_20975, partial [Verrucomicrobiae bacterium]|nr:hypothetical protein [Verrucomicrobiae bacterium]